MRRVEKPWGHELIWAETSRYVGKLLHITQGQKLSRQYHVTQDGRRYRVHLQLVLEIGPANDLQIVRLAAGQTYHCTPGTIHRMIAVTDVDVMEVSTPELDDVVRLEDAYGREGTSAP